MMRVFAVVALPLILWQAAQAQAVLTATGYGPIVFGNTLEQASKAINEAEPAKSPEDGDCRYVQFKSLPGVELMVENGVITRADASPSVRNALNISVGVSLKLVKRKFPSARITAHQYDPAGHYITIVGANKKSALVLEEGHGVITDIRAGLMPSVQYVERCL